eukprot:gene16171-biopygen20251
MPPPPSPVLLLSSSGPARGRSPARATPRIAPALFRGSRPPAPAAAWRRSGGRRDDRAAPPRAPPLDPYCRSRLSPPRRRRLLKQSTSPVRYLNTVPLNFPEIRNCGEQPQTA